MANRSNTSSPLRGLLIICLTNLLFALTDIQAKYLSQTLPIFQIAWARYLGYLAFTLLAFYPKRRRQMFSTKRLRLQIFRSMFLLICTLLFFTALSYMPIADAGAITFCSPVLIAALSVPLLKEPVGRRRWTAVVVGFMGTLIIIRPGMGIVHEAAFLALGSAVLFSLFSIATRMLSSTDDSATTLVYPGLTGAVVLSLLVPFQWQQPTGVLERFLLLTLGVYGGLAHYLMIRAYKLAPAALVAPMNYSYLVWSTGLGLLVFGDFPDRWTLLGAGILVTSGLYILHRERSERKSSESRE